MEFDTDIVIVGGGLTGPALALATAQAGLRSIVVDALNEPVLTDPEFDGRSYALARASQRLLNGIGVWPHVANDAQEMLDVKVTDGQVGQGPGPFGFAFDHAEVEGGPMGYMVEDRHIRRALHDAIVASDAITPCYGLRARAQSATSAGVTLDLSDGRQINARLLVGSDGRSSGTAARAGIQRLQSDYGQTALVCALAHEKPHDGTAYQIFLPSGPLAILPLKGNRCSIVWSEEAALAAHINTMDDTDYLAALTPRFGDFLGDLRLAGKRYSYPLNLTLAKRLIDTRLALIGDAAHGVHPIAGQGLNAGLRDVGALAEVLITAMRRGEDIGASDVLARYQQWRRFDTMTLALATDGFNRLFSNDNPFLRLGRGIGMSLMNVLPDVRRSFIREAAGLSGDVPALLRGEPI